VNILELLQQQNIHREDHFLTPNKQSKDKPLKATTALLLLLLLLLHPHSHGTLLLLVGTKLYFL